MIGAIVAAALWALAAGVLFSLLLGVLVAAAIALTRPAAATRGAMWTLALTAAGFAPVVIVAVMLARGALAGAAGDSAGAAARWSAAQPHLALAPTIVPPALRGAALRVPGPPDVAPLVAGTIVAVWALGALIGLAGLGRSLARVRGLKGRSSPLDGALATELPWLTTTPGREIYLRLSYETETPIAVGFRRPVILLPTEMATADGLTSIEPLIMHEYAHLARYDDWLNLVQRAIERVFWYNPLVWILGGRIALEREVAADEAVVARTNDAKRYASTLWRMAQEMRMPEHVVVAPGAMLTRKQISVRIERLLAENPTGPRYASAAALVIFVVAVCGVAALAASAPPVTLAQTETPDEPIAPAAPPRAQPEAFVHPAPEVHPAPRVVPKPVVLPSEAEEAVDDAVDTETDRLPVTRELLSSCVGCNFSRRDLSGLDLSNISLVGDNFDRATLRGVNFSHSNLSGVTFQRADLSHANFRGARLSGVDLSRATLDGTDLSDTSLTGVDLDHATLAGAKTTGMQLFGTSLP